MPLVGRRLLIRRRLLLGHVQIDELLYDLLVGRGPVTQLRVKLHDEHAMCLDAQQKLTLADRLRCTECALHQGILPVHEKDQLSRVEDLKRVPRQVHDRRTILVRLDAVLNVTEPVESPPSLVVTDVGLVGDPDPELVHGICLRTGLIGHY